MPSFLLAPGVAGVATPTIAIYQELLADKPEGQNKCEEIRQRLSDMMEHRGAATQEFLTGQESGGDFWEFPMRSVHELMRRDLLFLLFKSFCGSWWFVFLRPRARGTTLATTD